MADSQKRKAKILYLMKIFLEETDEEHGLTMPQLIKKLENLVSTYEANGKDPELVLYKKR